MRKIVKVLLL